ncbi:hypothetical protein HDU79_010312 [Rhizoclosmatium sp. JEL0117]|nr:hypothetical protein HDU79_010312 [Rhizoclosmatium sp. JEL0117]
MTPASLPLVRAGLICFTFFLVELIAGLWCGSLAILSDSVHLFTDVIGYAVAVAAVEIGTWQATKTYTFGFARVELIGALISLFLTWNLCFGLIEEALNRIHEPQEINVVAMLVSAIFGVAANTFMAFTLQDPHDLHDDDNHHHLHFGAHDSDGESDDSIHLESKSNPETSTLCNSEVADIESQQLPPKKKQNINIQAAMVHILGDLLGSISILIAALVLVFKPSYTFVDPLCTIVFACIIFASSIGLAQQYIMILMETCPGEINVDQVKEGVEGLNGVVRVEDCKVWSLTRGKDCCIVVVVVEAKVVENIDVGTEAVKEKSGSAFMGLDEQHDLYSSEDVTATVLEMEERRLVQFEEPQGEENGYNAMLSKIRNYLKQEYGFDEVTVEVRVA